VYIFENKGAVIGVTLTHPHGQVYAFPFIPPRVERELKAEARYLRERRRCMLCDMMKAETRQGLRIVAANGDFVAWIPFFARYPYEVHIVSRRHLGHLGEMTTGERWALAGILKTVLAKYDHLFGFSMPYIMLMHQTPTDGRRHRSHHFHIEFYPPHRSADKIKYLAGCESGAGTFINDTIVEEKAAELRRTPPRVSR
jgi:UDPglucose--hexose-1-phosphate uridylyltransferase